MKNFFSSITASSLFLFFSSISFIILMACIIFVAIPECKIESQERLGVVSSADEVTTSFNDFRRMKINVENDEFGGQAGVYFIKGITNIRNRDNVFLVKTNCGSKIKFGRFEKLFGTFESVK